MSELSGDSLLEKFKELDINIGSLNPNVIKAWYDTDCTKTKYLLKWICTSISEENTVTPQENTEFQELDRILTDNQLEEEAHSLNNEFPGIFQSSSTCFDIEIDLGEEFEILVEENLALEEQIQSNQKLKQSLANEYSHWTTEEIRSNLKQETALKTCLELSEELDETNNKIFEQILKHNNCLSLFDCDINPQFINNFDITEFEIEYHSIVNYINSDVKKENILDISSSHVTKQRYLEIQNRIYNSKVACLLENMKINELNQVMKLMNSYTFNNFFLFNDCEAVKLNIESKKNQLKLLLDMVKQSCLKQAENIIKPIKLENDKNELLILKSRLEYFTKLEDQIRKILAHYRSVYLLYFLEVTDLNSLDQFFRKINSYITKDLSNCSFRSNSMLKVIAEFEQFQTQPVEKKLGIIKDINNILATDRELSLMEIAEEITAMKTRIKECEERYIINELKTPYKPKNILDNIEAMSKFLMCGPTNKIITIQPQLFSLIQEVNFNLKQQKAAVQLSMQTFQATLDKRSSDKWLKYRGQLWVYFLTDPEKFLATFEKLKLENST